ncbi:MAG: hypothetical protein P8H56_08825 [Crocinitomicaceae bacterium]|nr:hypothetical protein [Crocinitomicaceae bacterium]
MEYFPNDCDGEDSYAAFGVTVGWTWTLNKETNRCDAAIEFTWNGETEIHSNSST